MTKNAEERAQEIYKELPRIWEGFELNPDAHTLLVAYFRVIIEIHEAQARKEALREVAEITRINVHEHAPYPNGMRRGFEIVREEIKKLMEDDHG